VDFLDGRAGDLSRLMMSWVVLSVEWPFDDA
jgi:hypothetical protein